MRRRRRPGVTAAATTAVLATGAGPGVTALVTTAALATGWPTTPRLPTRVALSGMSASGCLECLVRFDGGKDRLGGDSAVGDQLSARTAGGRGERRGPDVLVDDDSGRAARIHGGGEMFYVVLGQQLGKLGFQSSQLSEVVEVGQLGNVHRAVIVLDQDEHVDDADSSPIDQSQQLGDHLTGEAGGSGRELDDHVVHGTKLIH